VIQLKARLDIPEVGQKKGWIFLKEKYPALVIGKSFTSNRR